MKRVFLVLLIVLGVVAILAGIVAVVVAGVAAAARGSVPSTTVLEADLEAGFEENTPDDPIALALGNQSMNVVEFVQALERASQDDRVSAFVARIGAAPMGLARIQEVRDAVIAFRKSGKPAIAWAETMGEFGSGTGAYYLASAFDEIYLQPSGDIGFTGLMYESIFLRGTFDKLGIVPRMDHRHEYKNAMNTYTETKYTASHREAMDRIMQSQFGQIVRGIAEARDLTEEKVRAIADNGPVLGGEAVELDLVDGMLYRDEVYEKVREKAGASAKFLYIQKYWERAGSPHKKGATIAFIHGVGAVQRGSGSAGPFADAAMGSDTVAAAFRAASEDESVKAILFRVDSPGGSYVASDTIYRAVLNAQKAGKPVVVSMGDLAGSGGYFVAMSADKIVAHPGTITASIGVLAGKLLTNGFWEKLGLSFDEVHTSGGSTMWTGTKDYTPEQWARFQAWLDRIYEDFTGKVAEGRKLPKEKVLEIAKGRIWSGADARELGLVDELGGFATALVEARKAAGIESDAPVTLKAFPRKRSFLETLMDKGPDSSERAAESALVREVVTLLRPWVRVLRELGIGGTGPQVLSMPPIDPEPAR